MSMDNLTHAFAAITCTHAVSRERPSASTLAAAVLAANLQDVDWLPGLYSLAVYLEVHRGIAHSLLAVTVSRALASSSVSSVPKISMSGRTADSTDSRSGPSRVSATSSRAASASKARPARIVFRSADRRFVAASIANCAGVNRCTPNTAPVRKQMPRTSSSAAMRVDVRTTTSRSAKLCKNSEAVFKR